MFGSAATGPVSQFSRTAHQDRIHQLDCVVAMTGNQNILLSFALYESDPFLDRKPAAQLRKQISAVIALTLPILSINPDGASGTHSALLATVAVKENKFTYPGILSSELESLDERERAYASLGRVETLSLPPEQEVEIQSGKLYLWRLCLVS